MKLKPLLLGVAVLFLISTQFIRCTKINPTDIGTDLLPAIDNIHTFDTTLRVYADNFLFDDSTTISLYEPHALGLIEDDPVFGKTDAQIYLALAPNSLNRNPFISLDSVVGIDSAVLSLAYAGAVFGDSTSNQKISVFEVSDPLFKDSLGYQINHPHFNTTGPDLAGSIVNFSQFDDEKMIVVKQDTQNVSNVLRLPIDPALGLRFAGYDTTVYPSTSRDSAFQKAFNGLAIRVDAGGTSTNSALGYFNPAGENTRLTFYFRVMRNGVVDTLTTDFVPFYTSSSVTRAFSANIIERTPAHEYADLSLTTPVEGPEKLLIQSSPGSFALLRVPGLKALNNRIIHRAELSFVPAGAPGSEIFNDPDRLFLDLIDSANNRFLTVQEDFLYNSSTLEYDVNSFGGFLKNNRFFFNLTRYVQSMVTRGDYNYAFRLYAPKAAVDHYVFSSGTVRGIISTNRLWIPVNSYVSKGRSVIYGGGTGPQSMTVRIIYSKI